MEENVISSSDNLQYYSAGFDHGKTTLDADEDSCYFTVFAVADS